MTDAKESKKNCKCCLLLGFVIALLGITADHIGIGGGMGVGLKQGAVIIVGLVIFIFGFMPCKFDKFCKCNKDKS
ncbi:MAG: hypothetical protein A2Y03_06765 [Omnitrophica WOR_2 bacterium GWF2_38_59]|nr:MAG: hypothetical protein A2Y06_01840 [Omnitrophica WOR_2 bacterium GWA2_37_7]OGX23139.1 MAG: hypothetical protein A2Y03_06765 [Omnitrophica WOR_2 bacterium GWF2_38_59]OGX46850.1 MAG: hypothetical protein A2243_05830 [Omnitrophica WOR_2 bacterium RIFOXYA2_FULL_38_17]OGX53967.1 MAG: hypothetical protein A2267_02680 [Omnitrophica WOR_2 bacterium RIFOXYA12_FULL_38_10]OGX56999.1 MAG: hypothetical protein A2306_03325 [Omnitrophica WOR_2 bacterium RIFOXYB2_FULL_38_16]OGX59535.1 MAG: hypothetical 